VLSRLAEELQMAQDRSSSTELARLKLEHSLDEVNLKATKAWNPRIYCSEPDLRGAKNCMRTIYLYFYQAENKLFLKLFQRCP
jgi:hypothetical protein